MAYLKIFNLYRPESQDIFSLGEVCVLEKLHGTSAHIALHRTRNGTEVKYFAGGESYENFKKLFDEQALIWAFEQRIKEDCNDLIVYGEAYGGKQQGMSATYGKALKFVAFDVKADGEWLDIKEAEHSCKTLGIEFVHYDIVSATVEALDAARLKPSTQAVRNGITEPKPTEGVVIRPLTEMTRPDGTRVIAKHKNPEFSERTSKRDTQLDPDKKLALEAAGAVADEFVTEERLRHVLAKLTATGGFTLDMQHTPDVIRAMVEDVTVEGEGEFEDTKDVRKAIGAAAAKMYKAMVSKI